MCKTIAFLLFAAVFFCLAGCYGVEKTTEMPDSEALPPNQGEVSSGSSASDTEGLVIIIDPPEDSLDSTHSSSTVSEDVSESTDSSSSSESAGNWESPTGDVPFTSQKLHEYYESNPDLKAYYYTYLVPLTLLLDDTWDENTLIEKPSHYIAWLMLRLSEEEKAQYVQQIDLNNNGTTYPMAEPAFTESLIERTFGVKPEVLRAQGMYDSKHSAYMAMGVSMGELSSYVITEVQHLSDTELVITYQRLYDRNFPDRTDSAADDGQNFQLSIQILDDGSHRYISNILI